MIESFCDILYGDSDEGWITINSFPDKMTKWFKLGGRPPRIDLEKHCYIGIGIRGVKLPSGRGEEKDVIGIPGLWLDLDYESQAGTHKNKTPLPPSVDACLDLLKIAPYEPSLIIHSGHGLQAYWLFNEVWYFDDQEENNQASNMNHGWQNWFILEAAKKGWHVDSTFDLSRVFRVPGSYNHKTEPPVPVKIIHQSSIRYQPSDFDDWCMMANRDVDSGSLEIGKKEECQDVRSLTSVPDRLKYLIINGDSLGKYASRSEALFACIMGLLKGEYGHQTIIRILTNPDNSISELPIEKGNKWLEAEIVRARRKFHAPHVEDTTNKEAGHLGDLLLYDAKGKPKETFYNMAMILEHREEWTGRLRFDTFRHVSTLDGKSMSDPAEYQIAEWLGREYGFGGNHHTNLKRAVDATANKHPYDSLIEWVNELPEWDGNPRIHSWMTDICGSPANGYTEWVGYVTLVQMMSRALNPGSPARLVPIWEGPENKGKSTAIAKLGGKWATTFKISMDSKEAHMAIQGYLVAELEELDTMYRTTEQRLKAFLTNQTDFWVPKYSNHTVAHPRRTVFIGTTNDSRYLKSLTGNTRFLPISVSSFDFEQLEEVREQLFAESLYTLRTNPSIRWWEEPEEVSGTISYERELRREINVYEEGLQTWLDGQFVERINDSGDPVFSKPRDEVTWQDIAKEFLKIESPERWKDKSLQAQILGILPTIGWQRVKVGSRSYWARNGTIEEDPF